MGWLLILYIQGTSLQITRGTYQSEKMCEQMLIMYEKNNKPDLVGFCQPQ